MLVVGRGEKPAGFYRAGKRDHGTTNARRVLFVGCSSRSVESE